MTSAADKQQLVFAAIADDDTGASDLAGRLAEQQVRTVLVIDLPTPEQLQEWSRDCEAVVMAEGTRNLAPELARQKTRQALQLAQALGPCVLAIKYCSTFDSTPAGNIGPTIEVALDALGTDFTIALPALPISGSDGCVHHRDFIATLSRWFDCRRRRNLRRGLSALGIGGVAGRP